MLKARFWLTIVEPYSGHYLKLALQSLIGMYECDLLLVEVSVRANNKFAKIPPVGPSGVFVEFDQTC